MLVQVEKPKPTYTHVSIRTPLYERMAAVVTANPGHYASVPDLISQIFNSAYPDPQKLPVSAPKAPSEGEDA